MLTTTQRRMTLRRILDRYARLPSSHGQMRFDFSATRSKAAESDAGGCGAGSAGSPGFQHGNTCAPQRSKSTKPETPRQTAKALAEKKGASTSAADDLKAFHAAFDQAFTDLDRKGKGWNFVKLVDMRKALPQYSREQFDSYLRKLREQRLYMLNSHEGRHGPLTPEEREAAIREVGSVLAYVSRRD